MVYDTETIRATAARTGLDEDTLAAAWAQAAEYYGAEGASEELSAASVERLLTLAEDRCS